MFENFKSNFIYLKKNSSKALKQFNNINATKDEREKIKKQIDLLKKINHENVIQYLDFFVEPLGLNYSSYLLTRYYKVIYFF